MGRPFRPAVAVLPPAAPPCYPPAVEPSTQLRWSILGTGNIARQFAHGVRSARRSVLANVGSRTSQAATQFARDYAIPRAYGSYDAALADPDVDAVYISLPNSMHHQWTLKALDAGKHVLCEKPIATHAAQAWEMFDHAQKRGRYLIEAFMYRSHPLTLAVKKAIESGAIGDVQLIRTSFCFRTTRIDGNIRFNAALAGGSLMDIGCYCTNLSRFIANAEPTTMHATGRLHASGVDEMAAGTLTFPNGIIASFTCGMVLHADNTASICGTDGYIQVPIPWKPPAQQATYIICRGAPPRMDGGKTPPSAPPPQICTADAGNELYAVEADDFAASVLDGLPPRLSAADTIGNMQVLDELRRQVGVAF